MFAGAHTLLNVQGQPGHQQYGQASLQLIRRSIRTPPTAKQTALHLEEATAFHQSDKQPQCISATTVEAGTVLHTWAALQSIPASARTEAQAAGIRKGPLGLAWGRLSRLTMPAYSQTRRSVRALTRMWKRQGFSTHKHLIADMRLWLCVT